MMPDEAAVGLVVDYPIAGERLVISSSVQYFDGKPCVICKAGKRGDARIIALSALELIPEQKKGVQPNV